MHFVHIDAQEAQASCDRAEDQRGYYMRWIKRSLDIIAVIAVAPILIPIIAVMALCIAMDGKSPFFWQVRVGRDGKTFKMLKMRTMVPHAQGLLKKYLTDNPEAKAEWDAMQKLKHDPRITPIGRFLRRTSLDELTQLWNVMMGQMSLVGPRPILPSQRSLYPGTAYYSVRPGITGLWQVSARNTCDFGGRAEYDTIYASSVSFKRDCMLIARTIVAVIRGTGC